MSGSILPDELVIVDNNSSDKTKEIIKNFGSILSFKLKYLNSKKNGYPQIYNEGINNSSHNWIAFIDDDCVADTDWIKEIKKTIAKNTSVAVVMGWCETFYENNIYSQVSLLFDSDWKERGIHKDTVLDYEILDTKNIVYNKSFLKNHNLSFDETRSNSFLGAAQDCDLGIQIQENNGSVVLNRQMLIWHKDPQDFQSLIRKNINSFLSYNSLKKKWNLRKRLELKKKPVSLQKLISSFHKNHKEIVINPKKILVIAKLILVINKAMSLLEPFLNRNK